jgi:hypothetical protein
MLAWFKIRVRSCLDYLYFLCLHVHCYCIYAPWALILSLLFCWGTKNFKSS